jgi:hypothetical protein
MSDDQPFIRVVRGTPTAEELAALVGAILSRSRPVASEAAPGPSLWTRSARPGALIGGLPAGRGPDAWRASALPR